MAFLLCLKSENSGCALHQPAPLALHRPREHISASRPPRAKPQCPSLPACFSAMQPNKFPFPPYHLNRPIWAMHQPANLDIAPAKETCLFVGKREIEIPIPAPYFSALPVRYVPLYNAPAHRLICTFCQPNSKSIYAIPWKPIFPSPQPIKPIFVAQQAEFEILTLLFAAFMRQFFKHPQSRSCKRLSPHDTGVHLGTSRACWPHFLDKDQFPSN